MKHTSSFELAKKLKIPRARALEAILKADLIESILKAIERDEITHSLLAKRSGLPRSAVTGILSGSLQKVTIDRILKLIEAANLTAEIKVRKAVANE